MTILGSFDFPLAKIDSEFFLWECDTILFADGRISNRSRDGSNQVVIDTAPKLAVLEIRVRSKSKQVLTSEVVVGYAGASALVALSVLTFAGQILKNLKGETLPNVDQVATFIGEAFKASLHEYSENIHTALNMAAVICMFDATSQKTMRRQVSVVCRDAAYHANVSEPVSALSLVSGPAPEVLDSQIVSALKNDTRKVDAEYAILREVELHARAHSNGKPFGGQLQICRIGAFGVKLAATQFWDFSYRGPGLPANWNDGDYRTLLLGYDVSDLRVGQCDFVPDEICLLPDSDKTSWAKKTMKSEPRPFDDGDFFSQPRRGIF
ncbi:hypothetical protein ACCD08_06075 [Telluria sp. Tellsp104]